MIGREFGDFKIIEFIGAGNMAQVYVALQRSLNRRVALKIIKIKGVETLDLFLAEARMGGCIQHPNVVSVYSVGEEYGFCYIAMEYVEGISLQKLLEQGPLAEMEAWQIALQVCDALQAALEQHVIHRDIKPGNLLLTPQQYIKLTDFGISKKLDPNTHRVHQEVIWGTPEYMSPEQAKGEKLDFRTDIYALGATIYHLLTGKLMFSGKVFEILLKHHMEPPRHPKQIVEGLDKRTAYILAKMLQKQPEKRYQSYGDLKWDIHALLSNKPLTYANKQDALDVYQYSPPTRKSLKKLFGAVCSFFMGGGEELTASSKLKSLENFHRIILVSASTPHLQNKLLKYSFIQFHLVSSLAEFEGYLKNHQSFVILDSNYLGPKIVDFFDILKHKFPTQSLFIQGLLNINMVANQNPVELSPLPYGGKEGKLLHLLSPKMADAHFHSHQLSLQIILSLACKGKWTATLIINQNSKNEGRIVLNHGKIQQVILFHGSTSEEDALRFLHEHDESWKLDTSAPVNSISKDVLDLESKKVVLIVDDDYMILELYKEIIRQDYPKIKILTASNGEKAVEILKEKPVSLLLTDMKMPKMDGMELLAYMNKNHPCIPCAVITGYPTNKLREKVMQQGVHFIEKPINLNTIKKLIDEMLEVEQCNQGLKAIPIYTFFQLIELESRTCIAVIGGQIPAKVYFVRGEAYDAEYENLRGEEALQRILNLKDFDISFRDYRANEHPRIIHTELNLLIQKALQSKQNSTLERTEESTESSEGTAELSLRKKALLEEETAEFHLNISEEEDEKTIKILIVDDSKMMQKAIIRGLENFCNIEVVGTAINGEEALELIPELEPDVVTLDVNMPVMDGITTLKHIMVQFPLPVIMLSAFTTEGADTTFDCLTLGAVDFICKPGSNRKNIEKEITILAEKIMGAAGVNIRTSTRMRIKKKRSARLQRHEPAESVVLMGAGTSGYGAYLRILPYLPKKIPVAIIAVQYIEDNIFQPFCDYLNLYSRISVKTLENNEILEEGVCYFVKQDSRLVLEETNLGIYCSLDHKGGKKEGIVNEIFNTVVSIFQGKSIGVLLSGKEMDGKEGVKKIKEFGGKVFAQDPISCLHPENIQACLPYVDKLIPEWDIAQNIENFFPKKDVSMAKVF